MKYLLEKEEVSAKDFVIICAKTFGAFAHMRDEPLSAVVKYPNDPISNAAFHRKERQRMEEKLEILSAMSDVEIEEYNKKEKKRIDKALREDAAKEETIRKNIEAIKTGLAKWSAPTKEHVSLYNYVKERLGIMENNNKRDLEWAKQELKKISRKNYYKIQVKFLKGTISYHKKAYEIECRKKKDRSSTEWIKTLVESLDNVK